MPATANLNPTYTAFPYVPFLCASVLCASVANLSYTVPVASLREYHRKRHFEKTPEPRGSEHRPEDHIFVVQKHAATRLHYDLRLEVDGVLKSWAVPKGPSMNPADKRLAVQVEDHPFEYRTFEGSIPKGQYGGGEVIVWDNGTYEPEGTMSTKQQLERGELKFTLFGEKLHGSFVLVRTRSKDSKPQWLLIKHRDAYADPNWDDEAHPESVVTGRTLQEIAAGVPASKRKPAKSKKKGPDVQIPGAVKAAMPSRVSVTLAKLADKPFSDSKWLFEVKWDGVRTFAYVNNGKTKLESRSARDVTSEFPEFRDLAAHLDAKQAILDGEIVTLDAAGRSDFHALQNRLGVHNPSPRLQQSVPVIYYVFDLLYCDGYDLRKSSLVDRKNLLEQVLRPNDRVRYSSHELEHGEALYEAARENGLEGILAKCADSIYPGTRTDNWLKLKVVSQIDAVVAGYTTPRGSRRYFGALVLGLYEKGKLRYIGNVGTGFNEEALQTIFESLQSLRTNRMPFEEEPAVREEVQWLRPELVARVKYANWTPDSHLRAPVFLSFRNDRDAKDVTFDSERPKPVSHKPGKTPAAKPKIKPNYASSTAAALQVAPVVAQHAAQLQIDSNPPNSHGTAKAEPAPRRGKKSSPRNALEPEDAQARELRTGKSDSLQIALDGQTLNLSHLNKIFFPLINLRKRDLLAYYYRLAPLMIPFLKDRPMVLRRYPDGVGGKAFFQKEAPGYLPDWIPTATVYSNERGGDMQYILANDRATVLYLTNLGCIDHNPWSSRADSQDSPDYVFFDLDPTPETSFAIVIRVAKHIRALLEEIRLKSYMKTSGASGFHIFVPLDEGYTYEQVRMFAEIVGKAVSDQLPGLITFERTVSKRPKGRVLIDALQNAKGKPLASVYSVRAEDHAGVSTPVLPDDLEQGVRPDTWNLTNIDSRLARVGDLWHDFWRNRQSLAPALDRLSRRLKK
jgi:bifunctional non-homologous end joining protein LigD